MSIEKLSGLSKPFEPLSGVAFSMNPKISLDLVEANMEVNPRDYARVSAFIGVFDAIAMVILLTIVSFLPAVDLALGENAMQMRLGSIFGSFILGIVAIMQNMVYPKIKSRTKAREIERDLLYALRHLTVQIRAGSTLFDAMKSVANGGYGEVSSELEKTVREISSGIPTEEAISNMIQRVRSQTFRKIFWQIENAVRTGTDLGSVLYSLGQNFFQEQQIAIQKFGKDMSGLTMMFMMLTVVFPIMSIIFFVLSSLLPVPSLSSLVLYVFLMGIIVIQVFFIAFVKQKRPAISF
jgi:pilus assembly protein TadC